MTLWTIGNLRIVWRRWISSILDRFAGWQTSTILTEDLSSPPLTETPLSTSESQQQTSKLEKLETHPSVSTPPLEEAQPPRAVRRKEAHDYRKLVKARMKFDKMVTPKGVLPDRPKKENVEPKPKKTTKPETEEIQVEPSLTEKIIGSHYDDDPNNPIVLYELSEFWGQYNFRDTILDQLDRYWFYLDRMEKEDPDAWGFYKKVGMQMVPYVSVGVFGKIDKKDNLMTAEEIEKYKGQIKLPPAFKRYRPGFGCVAFGANPKVEAWEKDLGNKSHFPRFLYYTKYKGPPPDVQMITGGDIYSMTIWFDDYRNPKKKWGVPNTFPVFISRDGQHIQLLKVRNTRLVTIQKKVRKKGSGDEFSIPERGFYIPNSYEKWAQSYGVDAETHLTHIFCYAAKVQETSQFGDVRVTVHKGDMAAIFYVSSRRMSYFFQDRDIELTEGGLRKRLFHIVKPHVRKDGVAVKMHYRGESKFTWAGYEVEVTVPGRDYFIQHEMNIGAWDEETLANKEPSVTLPEFGEALVNLMNQGVGGTNATTQPGKLREILPPHNRQPESPA